MEIAPIRIWKPEARDRVRLPRGFTLVEVIIVAIIVVILAVATVPRFARTAERFRSEQAVFDFVQQLRYSRDQAISAGSTVDWVWDPTDRHAHLEMLGADGYVPLTGRFARSRELPGWLTATLTNQDDERISFFPDGSCEPASLQIISPQRTYTITVDATTGQVVLGTGPAAR